MLKWLVLTLMTVAISSLLELSGVRNGWVGTGLSWAIIVAVYGAYEIGWNRAWSQAAKDTERGVAEALIRHAQQTQEKAPWN